jgi:hypothetical protein
LSDLERWQYQDPVKMLDRKRKEDKKKAKEEAKKNWARNELESKFIKPEKK